MADRIGHFGFLITTTNCMHDGTPMAEFRQQLADRIPEQYKEQSRRFQGEPIELEAAPVVYLTVKTIGGASELIKNMTSRDLPWKPGVVSTGLLTDGDIDQWVEYLKSDLDQTARKAKLALTKAKAIA